MTDPTEESLDADADPRNPNNVLGPHLHLKAHEEPWIKLIVDGYPLEFPIAPAMSQWFPKLFAQMQNGQLRYNADLPNLYFFHEAEQPTPGKFHCGSAVDLRKVSAFVFFVRNKQNIDRDAYNRYSQAFERMVALMERNHQTGEEWRKDPGASS